MPLARAPWRAESSRLHARRWWLLALLLISSLVMVGPGLLSGSSSGWTPSLVIFLALDTCRADYLGCYGNRRAITPNIDALARESLVFDSAFSQSNRTLVSFSSLFTGLYPPLFSKADPEQEDWHVAARYPTLASVVSSYGGRTAAFVTNTCLHSAFGFKHGFEVFKYSEGSFSGSFAPAMAWLDAATPAIREHRLHFLFLHGNDIHSPMRNVLGLEHLQQPGYRGPASEIAFCNRSDHYIRGRRYYLDAQRARRALPHSLAGQESDGGEPYVTLSDEDLAYVSASYAGRVTFTDLYVGVLVQYLRRRHLDKDTLIVLFGDHGEWLLEDGRTLGHGTGTADPVTHVPLILWGPGGVRRPQHIQQVVELCDLFPTVLDLCHLHPKLDLPGVSLLPLLRGASAVARPEAAISIDPGKGRSQLSVRTREYRYMEGRTPDLMMWQGLFRIGSDPLQCRDLSHEPGSGLVCNALSAFLWARLKRAWCLVND